MLGKIDNARVEIRGAVSAYGQDLDDVTRELLSALDACDRARKRLLESAARAMRTKGVTT